MRGADDDECGADQQRPQDGQPEIEAADELAEGDDDLRAALGERAGDRGEHRERREAHHVIGDLEHHRARALRRRGRSACPRSPMAVSATPKKSEKMTIGRISFGAHRLEDRRRDDVGDEILEVERGGLDPARGSRRRDRQVEADAGLKQR